MDFKLESKFKPTGDQPRAIAELTAGIQDGHKDQTLLGVTGSGKTFTLANVIAKTKRPTLVISHNKTLAAQLTEEFKSFFPQNTVHYFVSYYDYYQPEAYMPRTDTYIEKETSINEEIDRLRNAATHAVLTRKDVIVVASVSCIYGLGNPENYLNTTLAFIRGQTLDRRTYQKKLLDMRYTRNNLEILRGEFRLRGDTLEIHPSYGQTVIRIEFFDALIEKISEIHPISGEVIQVLNEYHLFPAKHFILPDTSLQKIFSEIRADLSTGIASLKRSGRDLEAQRLKQRTEFDLEMIQETGYCNGIENYSRYFDRRNPGEPPNTLMDYFIKAHKDNYLLVIDESHITIPQIRGMYAGDQVRKQSLIEYGFRLSSALDNRPLKFKEFEGKVNQAIFASATPGEYEHKHSTAVIEQIVRPTGLLDPEISIKPTINQIDNLTENIRETLKRNERVLVTTLTKASAENLSAYLEELKIKVAYLHHEVDTMERTRILQKLRAGIFDVVVGINLLREGLDLPEVSLVAILDADKEGFLRSDWSLIQVMGRAARHINGRVIMYADRTTDSMLRAITETTRRREIQKKFNQKNGISPRSIQKTLDFELDKPKLQDIDKQDQLSKRALEEVIKDHENQMEIAARNLEFEKAAMLRDQLKELRNHLPC
jgi:excinuclease ABC subunit B